MPSSAPGKSTVFLPRNENKDENAYIINETIYIPRRSRTIVSQLQDPHRRGPCVKGSARYSASRAAESLWLLKISGSAGMMYGSTMSGTLILTQTGT